MYMCICTHTHACVYPVILMLIVVVSLLHLIILVIRVVVCFFVCEPRAGLGTNILY